MGVSFRIERELLMVNSLLRSKCKMRILIYSTFELLNSEKYCRTNLQLKQIQNHHWTY